MHRNLKMEAKVHQIYILFTFFPFSVFFSSFIGFVVISTTMASVDSGFVGLAVES